MVRLNLSDRIREKDEDNGIDLPMASLDKRLSDGFLFTISKPSLNCSVSPINSAGCVLEKKHLETLDNDHLCALLFLPIRQTHHVLNRLATYCAFSFLYWNIANDCLESRHILSILLRHTNKVYG